MAYVNYLRTFVTVYRCGSHNKASEILGLTQPAISKHITALEQQMGKRLFYRDGPKRYEAMEVAHALAKELALHIDQIEKIFNASRANTPDLQGIVYIGGLCEFAGQHLTYTISSLMPHNIQFVVQQEKGVDWRRLLDIRFEGHDYHLGDVQAKILRLLHDASRSRNPWVHGKTLIYESGSSAVRMRDLFKNKPHWRKLILTNDRG